MAELKEYVFKFSHGVADDDGQMAIQGNFTGEEIVRCEDCEYHMRSCLCKIWSQHGTVTTHPREFCARGVKRKVKQ